MRYISLGENIFIVNMCWDEYVGGWRKTMAAGSGSAS